MAHGFSHFLAFLVGSFLTLLLNEVLQKHVPPVLAFLRKISVFLNNVCNVTFFSETILVILAASLVFFYFGHKFGKRYQRIED